MNPDADLKLLRELASDQDRPSAEARMRARAALLARAQPGARKVTGRMPRWSRPPLRLEYLAFGFSALVAIAVVAVFLSTRGGRSSGSPGRGGIELVYQAEPTPQTPVVTSAALGRAAAVMRTRLALLGVPGGSVRTSGPDEITVGLPAEQNLARVEAEVGATARIEFYDWEANALTPNGKPVAGQLRAQVPSAVSISQGGSGGPGGPGGGGMSLYAAVKLASKQPLTRSPHNSRLGSQYYLFGAGGSPACAAAARFYGVPTAPSGTHCLLAGPDASAADLVSGLPAGVTASEGRRLVVKQGTVVLQATPSNLSHPPKVADPSTRFYVLEDNVALLGSDITNPQQSTDSGGSPDVTFGFDRKGARQFRTVTRAIAHRGQGLGSPTQPLLQHFAVALDNALITVPSIDFRTYPDGVDGSTGAQIPAGPTIRSAKDLAIELRAGALPVALKQISQRQVPAAGG
jgi:hypothetical protein